MKFISKKRIVSTVLAGVMALSMTAPAFASANTNITASYNPPTLSVVVPTTGKATINPYGLPYKLGEATVTGQKIGTTTPLLIQNKSSVALSVSASVTGTAVGTFTFVAADVADGETGNKGNVKLQLFPADGISAANAADTEVLNAKYAALKDADALGNIVLATTAASDTDILTLKKGTADGELQDGGAAFFRLSGTVAKKPTVAWTKSDGFTAAITFTFDPTTDPAVAGGTIASSVTGDMAQLTDNTANLTLTPSLPSGVTVADWVWSSSDATKISVTEGGSQTTATASWVAAGTVTITARGTGSDGITYEATIQLKAV